MLTSFEPPSDPSVLVRTATVIPGGVVVQEPMLSAVQQSDLLTEMVVSRWRERACLRRETVLDSASELLLQQNEPVLFFSGSRPWHYADAEGVRAGSD